MNEFLGKLFFPHLQPDVQRRKIAIILTVLLVSLLLGGSIAFAMVYRNKMGVR
jgi:flagellar basal body-associated protein FliL